MSTTSRPQKKMQDKSPIEELSGMYEAMLPKEFGGAVNLFIHPMAGAAAMSAIGFGLASHAMGMWLGAVAGAAEASRRMIETGDDAALAPKGGTQRGPKLSIVASNDLAEVSAMVRTVVADAERVSQDVAEVAQNLAEDAVARAAAAVSDAASRKAMPATARKAAAKTTGPAKPQALPRPDRPDDLKAISGIGPKLEQVLNGHGIWTYGQIARLEEAEIAWLDDKFGFSGRIVRDDWTGQARELAGRR